jgi:signal-transduction protein with cAMP-binding, CBS, and nucleotidyltransferase domain
MNTGFDGASSVDVLGGLPADERRTLERIAKRRRLRAGDFLYTQGDAVEHFYIVESGRVRVFYQTPAGREPTVTYRGPGDLFGISSLAGSDRRVPSAQALEPSVIWAIANQDGRPRASHADQPKYTEVPCEFRIESRRGGGARQDARRSAEARADRHFHGAPVSGHWRLRRGRQIRAGG